jgi:O-Antigen ligase
MKGLPSWFMPLWCVLMPLTSFLLIPSVQGTIPAYVLGFVSLFFVIVGRDSGQANIERIRYFRVVLLVAGIWLLLLCGSQLGHLLSNRHDFGDMLLINVSDTSVVLRSTLFTQSLYLAACVCIALFFRFFFRAEWMRYVLWGGWFLAIYGIYEWLFFLIFHQPGDFIGNRTYGEFQHTGSWSQAIQVGPFNLLRIKSTFGEPSFFSAGVIPYLFLALENKRNWLTAALLFCTIFSTSSSAYVGLAFALILYSFFRRKLSRSIVLVLLLFAAAFATLYYVFPETYDQMFTAKMNGENDSGQSRQDTWAATQDTANTFTLMNRLFGIGFGYYYGGVYYAIPINTGWIGMIVYCYAFLKPVVFLRTDHGGLALKVGIAALFFLFYVSVSELFLPTTWMFLGLAYWGLDQQREQRKVTQLETVWTPVPAR